MLNFKKFFLCPISLFLFASLASGQSNPSPNAVPSHLPYNGATARVDGAHIPPIPQASFSAKALVETTQTLADGTTVTHKTYNVIARDFRGRTHNEFRYWIPADGSEPRMNYSVVYDPDSHTRTFLYPGTHFARQQVLKVPAPNQTAAAPNASAGDVTKKDLGSDFQNGLSLTGTLETRTYPSGSIGNDNPITITSEFWYSPDLQLNISVKRIDPRFGTQTVRITELQRSEPDASLFDIPTDYKVVTENGLENLPSTGGFAPVSRVRQGGNVTAASLINRVQPQYPAEARKAHIQGTVRLHVILAKDGTVDQIQVVSGHPALAEAALEAVRQWRYRRTLLNGEPVEVDTTIDVIFSLQ